jgi:hypothetical protein
LNIRSLSPEWFWHEPPGRTERPVPGSQKQLETVIKPQSIHPRGGQVLSAKETISNGTAARIGRITVITDILDKCRYGDAFGW